MTKKPTPVSNGGNIPFITPKTIITMATITNKPNSIFCIHNKRTGLKELTNTQLKITFHANLWISILNMKEL